MTCSLCEWNVVKSGGSNQRDGLKMKNSLESASAVQTTAENEDINTGGNSGDTRLRSHESDVGGNLEEGTRRPEAKLLPWTPSHKLEMKLEKKKLILHYKLGCVLRPVQEHLSLGYIWRYIKGTGVITYTRPAVIVY